MYDSSNEEQAQADSQEKCTQEVKVKPSDAENPESSTTGLNENSACETDLHHTKSDMEQSIKMAKEAVEKLQHMEHDWKHSNSGPDAELHKDIEVARKALEHIQQNFGHLEAMDMQATTLSNTEAFQDAHLHIAKGKKVAQWMEAINNIQGNAEIARNLEDAFPRVNHQDHMIEQGKSNNELENIHNNEKSIKNSSNNELSNLDKFGAKETKTGHEAIHENMKTAVSEMTEAKFDHLNKLIARVDRPVTATKELSPATSSTAKSLLDRNIHAKMHGEDKSSRLDTKKHPVAAEHKTLFESTEPRVMKSAEVIKKKIVETKQSDTTQKALVSAKDTPQKSSIKSIERKNDFEHNVDTNSQRKGLLGIENNSKRAWMESNDNEMLAKASEHIPIAVDHKKIVKELHDSEQTILKKRVSTSALHNHFDTESHHHLLEASAFPAQTYQMTSAKNAADGQNINDLHNTDRQRVVTFGLPMSHQNMMPMHHHHNQPHFPSAHHQFYHPSHDFHHNFHGNEMYIKAAEHEEAQEKAAEIDNTAQGTLQINMNRFSGKSDSEHSTHWKQEQKSAIREVYGSYGLAGTGVGAIGASTASNSGGPGAIGVFPNVNTGCAIPLLLSCSPSVVSGSLAKAHSGYEASVYRAGENVKLHTKRDTRKNNKITAPKAKWTLAKLQKETSLTH